MSEARPLAYVFWHWSRPEVAAADYDARQRAFHAALAAAPPGGFARSFSAAVSGAPWVSGGGAAHEDWYVVEDFAALGLLNEAAVTGSRAGSHDAAAVLAAGGTGGLYRLRLGNDLPAPRFAHWFGKPSGARYADFFAALEPLVAGARGALWMRQLTMGPAREFCLHAAERVALPAAFGTLALPLRPLWPAG
jgi:hypothetical protein